MGGGGGGENHLVCLSDTIFEIFVHRITYMSDGRDELMWKWDIDEIFLGTSNLRRGVTIYSMMRGRY